MELYLFICYNCYKQIIKFVYNVESFMTYNINNTASAMTCYMHGCELPEINGEIFSYLSPFENMQTTMLVCKTWREHSENVVKWHFISKKESDLNNKMLPFLEMTGKEVIDYSPVLKEIKENYKDLSVKETFDKLLALTEKHNAILGQAFTVAPDFYDAYLQSSNNQIDINYPFNILDKSPALINTIRSRIGAAKERKEDICGKTFVGCHSPTRIYSSMDLCEHTGIYFFPLELFNLKINPENQELIGKRDNVTHCFSLSGKLIELTFVSNEDFSIPKKVAIMSMGPKCYEDFYVLRLHSNLPAQNPSTSETK